MLNGIIHPELTRLVTEYDLTECFATPIGCAALRALSNKYKLYDKVVADCKASKQQSDLEWKVKYDYLEARHKEALEKLYSKG